MVLFNLFSDRITEEIKRCTEGESIEEIRFRLGKPLRIRTSRKDIKCDYLIDEKDIRDTLEFATNHSAYAYGEEIRDGYITVEGGHRIGICGKTVYENNEIKTIRNISALNIRVAHDVKGCSCGIVEHLINNGDVLNTLIISTPGCGKTTLIRDITRIISDKGINVSVVDERSEIAACYHGKPQNDVGECTDVMDSCPKKHGMIMMVRSMSPDVIVIDEVGSNDDAVAMEYAINSGCSVIATIHGSSIKQVREKGCMRQIINSKRIDRYVVIRLEKKQRIYEIYNNDKELIKIENTGSNISNNVSDNAGI